MSIRRNYAFQMYMGSADRDVMNRSETSYTSSHLCVTITVMS